MTVARLHAPHGIHVVSSGDEVIAYLSGAGIYQDRKNHPYPSLLLLDLIMPGTNGFAVLNWISKHPEHRALPVIVLSVVRELREISQAYQLGARSFLMKPLTIEDLRRALHAMAILPDPTLLAAEGTPLPAPGNPPVIS